MNKSIHVTELKHGETAVITKWVYPRVVGMIVHKYYYSLHVLSDNPQSDNWICVTAITNPECQVRVLKPGTTFKLTDKGLIIESEPPTPLFISEDGVELYPEMRCYPYNTHIQSTGGQPNGCNVSELVDEAHPGNSHGWLVFSTERARQEYIDKHKVYLTTDDGVSIRKGDKYWFVDKKTLDIGSGKETGTISHTSYEFVYFSTKEKAEEYVFNNRTLLITEEGKKLKKGDTYYHLDRKTLIINECICSGFYLPKDYNNEKYAFFSTKEKAEEYVNSKKTFTLNDLNDFLEQDKDISQFTINRFKEYLKKK